jgi:hypothetical protein
VVVTGLQRSIRDLLQKFLHAWLCALGKESTMQWHGYGLVASRGDIAMALHEWHSALATADASVESEIYRCAIDLVMEYLAPCATVRELLDAYYFPEIALLQLVKELCTEGEILLQPRLLLRASCALMLRQLVGEVVA